MISSFWFSRCSRRSARLKFSSMEVFTRSEKFSNWKASMLPCPLSQRVFCQTGVKEQELGLISTLLQSKEREGVQWKFWNKVNLGLLVTKMAQWIQNSNTFFNVNISLFFNCLVLVTCELSWIFQWWQMQVLSVRPMGNIWMSIEVGLNIGTLLLMETIPDMCGSKSSGSVQSD